MESPHPLPPVIEVGWIVASALDAADAQAFEQAREQLLETLRQILPGFVWKMPVIRRPELVTQTRLPPSSLFDHCMHERTLRNWDFTFVVTSADLQAHYKPYAFAVVSRALDIAVISTARIDPQAQDGAATAGFRVELMRRRLHALGLHLLGHLNALDNVEDRGNYMFDLRAVGDLDRLCEFTPEQIEQLEKSLHEIADPRLEETHGNTARLRFYLEAVWINRRELFDAVLKAHPWEFPFRFARLTTVALSTMLILLITAEAWELGMSQPPYRVAVLSALSVAATSIYLLLRQRLPVWRGETRMGELTVVANVSTFLIVLLGMAATYALLLLLTLSAGVLLFDESLVAGWLGISSSAIGFRRYAILAAFVSSLGMFMGALGASFEEQHYFRHVTYVDEEV